jgi:hypothetical protein
MTIQELYDEAKKYNYYSLVLLIDYLVDEQKVLEMNDSDSKINYYLQDRFSKKLNEHLAEYQKKRNGADETSKL